MGVNAEVQVNTDSSALRRGEKQAKFDILTSGSYVCKTESRRER